MSIKLRMSSDFECPVVRIGKMEKHGNADTLSVVEADGFPVIVRTEDFKEGDLAVYLPVESLIPEDREWVKTYCSHLKFKNGVHRLKAVRLRGVFSMGMLVPIAVLGPGPTPGRGKFGTDVSQALRVTKYEEPEEYVSQPRNRVPRTFLGRLVQRAAEFLAAYAWARSVFGLKRPRYKMPWPAYHVAQYRKSRGLLHDGEEVVVTEKIHGTNFVAGMIKGELIVSSHNCIREEDDSVYWRIARQYELATRLERMPGHAVYGEIYGPGVQDMTYGVLDGQLRLRVFDILNLNTGKFLQEDEFARACKEYLGLDRAPVLYRGPFSRELIEPMADGDSVTASLEPVRGESDLFREGVVIKQAVHGIQRVALKLVGQKYLLRKGGTERH